MKKILLFLAICSCITNNVSAQVGSVSNFSILSNNIEIGKTVNFSFNYTTNINASVVYAILKTKSNGTEIDWNTGMHWQKADLLATNTSKVFNGNFNLTGFYQSSKDIAPEKYIIIAQLVDKNGSGFAAVNNWGISPNNTITILSSPDTFNYKYLGGFLSNGVPLYLSTPDVISSSTLTLINNSLPEFFPVPEYNPHYITAGYDTDLVLNETSDVWVTFISEGAGFTNTLAYYTYDINNPPSTAPAQEDITIVYPNASADESGGGLKVGDKVNIGNFPAGTGIGWVLLVNAWDGIKVSHDEWKLFSNPDFNPETDPSLRQHNVLLQDFINDKIILGFEDVRRDDVSCDNDFNDAVFVVSSNTTGAIKSDNLAEVSTDSAVSSGNNGGLESNGDLATLIAKRNFNRIKTNSFADKKTIQKKFISSSITAKTSALNIDFSTIIPNTGMFGTETTYISSPTDLIGITNANQVYSVDYYEGDNRLAAVLATSLKDLYMVTQKQFVIV